MLNMMAQRWDLSPCSFQDAECVLVCRVCVWGGREVSSCLQPGICDPFLGDGRGNLSDSTLFL